MSGYTLPVGADTTDEYPTRCPKCTRPVERLSVFPRGLCIDCHAASAPMLTTGQIRRAFGGR